jgi:hypothetical protein
LTATFKAAIPSCDEPEEVCAVPVVSIVVHAVKIKHTGNTISANFFKCFTFKIQIAYCAQLHLFMK